MADCKFHITNSDDKVIAKAARDVARQFDPWGSARPWVYGAILGAIAIAALDFGDVWICAGDCQRMVESLKDAGQGGRVTQDKSGGQND